MSGPRGPAFSETWWGSRWIQALRRFGQGWSRGLTNARGATDGIHDLNISPGQIEAVVPGENGETYQLQVRLHTLNPAAWRRVLRRLAGKALYAARLLSGEMPRDIERVFAQSRASLFPRRRREIDFSCSCDQEYVPCSHVAAAQFVLAEAIDRDPFLLFELRGRSRDQVLAELREIRGAGTPTNRGHAEALADEDAWAQPRPEDYTVAGEDLATLGFHIAAADVPVGAIRALGPPRSWSQPLAVLKSFVPLYRAASASALDIAWSGEEEVPTSARLPEPETEASLVAMAESMAAPTLPRDDVGAPSRGGRRRRGRGGRKRGRRKSASNKSDTSTSEPDNNEGRKGAGRRRRRRRGRGKRSDPAQGGNTQPTQGSGSKPVQGGSGANSGSTGSAQGGTKKRRRRRRRGGRAKPPS